MKAGWATAFDGPICRSLLLARELKHAVIGVFAFLRKEPLLGEMVFILDRKDQLAHVPVV